MALTYEEIRGLNWFIADQVRDKGNGNNNDAMSVAIPTLIFKRLIDMRNEYKNQFNSISHSEQYNIMQLYGDLDQAIANYQNNASVFSVKSEHLQLYRIQFSDILVFPDEHDTDKPLDYTDGFGGQYISKSKNKVEFIEEIIHSFSNPKISEIFNYLDFSTKINSNNITQILSYQEFVNLLKELDKYDLSLSNAPSDVFSQAYMDLLQRFAPQKGSKQGEFHTPNKITKAGVQILQPKLLEEGVIHVSDPTSGACTFITEFAEYIFNEEAKSLGKVHLSDTERKQVSEKFKIITQEKDRVAFAAGEANLLLHGLLDRTEAFHGNTITEYSEKIGKYDGKCDYVLANPPFGVDDYGFKFAENAKKNGLELSRWGFGVPNTGDGELAFLQTIIALLNEKGKAVVVLPKGPGNWDNVPLRQILIEQKDWLEGMILFPAKLFGTTDIQTNFWIINKNKSEKDKDKVFFVNAENDFTKLKNKNDWNIEKTIEKYISRIEEDGYSKYVSAETLKKNNFMLSVDRYVKKETLKEIIDIEKTFLNIENIKKDLSTEQELINNIFAQVKLIYSKEKK